MPVLLAILLLSAFAPAQLRDRTPKTEPEQPQTKKPSRRGPRAIGVIEFLPGGGARLVPVALWIDGHYYDASLYGANPAPMALEQGTQYQGMNYGEPTGWFTVTTPKQINGNWVADGKWITQGALDARLAEQAAKQPKSKHSSSINDDQGPPVLRRAPGSGSDASAEAGSQAPPAGSSSGAPASSSGNPEPQSADDPDRPTLKAPATAASGSSRPTLGGDAESGSAPAGAPAPRSTAGDESDPDRPVLTRNKQPTAAGDSAAKSATVKTTANTGSPAPSGSSKDNNSPATAAATMHAYPAISDAGDYETRPMLYPMTPAEREEKARSLLPMAIDEIRNFASKRNAPALPKTAQITDYEMRAFDLDFSNSPTLVLTAKLPATSAPVPRSKSAAMNKQPLSPGPADYFATVVARLDINGQPIKIFSSVTDSNHLDAFPRLQVIDAVDADANGRGVLLFRQYAEGGTNYSLYRVFPYQMVNIFEGGSGL
ncbi:MAG: hypothetical protein P4M04_12425 [Acidobacteriota bacterium]|nr:hypothetical protein [Acidobacteriota bacterium]